MPDSHLMYPASILKPKQDSAQDRLAAMQCAAHAQSREELRSWLKMLGLTGTRRPVRP